MATNTAAYTGTSGVCKFEVDGSSATEIASVNFKLQTPEVPV